MICPGKIGAMRRGCPTSERWRTDCYDRGVSTPRHPYREATPQVHARPISSLGWLVPTFGLPILAMIVATTLVMRPNRTAGAGPVVTTFVPARSATPAGTGTAKALAPQALLPTWHESVRCSSTWKGAHRAAKEAGDHACVRAMLLPKLTTGSIGSAELTDLSRACAALGDMDCEAAADAHPEP